ncbi:hypothetical protein MOK15_20975 [Sphingobium sp. BYY-5]|uniref:hypothetical protein n=1 Tax=Sphingobium sp. BYY-5 TaxID=2926400 RepID=UPI001FA754D5|nr:hypothetical protein [Sphingobium sp. BYY-5]MCI4592536.1 hypothetical protein [Sphingobium sp. BYY-5]
MARSSPRSLSATVRKPQNARAIAWKGIAQTELTLTASPSEQDDALASARRTIEYALQVDEGDPTAAIAYFQSYARAGIKVPDAVVAGVIRVAAAVPTAPTPRMLAGEELVRQGKSDLAVELLRLVLFGAYDSPGKKQPEIYCHRS